MKNKIIAITGANGVLGKELTKILKRDSYEILMLHHDIEQVKEYLKVHDVFALIHCAFARNEEPQQLSLSLAFTKDVMRLANELGISRIINISSKSVYENNTQPEWDENTAVNPKGNYALAKYASELISDACITNPDCKLSHIRLASLIGPGMEQRVVTKLIRKVMNGQKLTITNGTQLFQYMDIRDAAEAILALLNTDIKNWKKIYCVAPDIQVSLQEIAQIVVGTCEKHGYMPVDIEVTAAENCCNGYMNPKLFGTDTGWREKYTLQDCVSNIIVQISDEKL